MSSTEPNPGEGSLPTEGTPRSFASDRMFLPQTQETPVVVEPEAPQDLPTAPPVTEPSEPAAGLSEIPEAVPADLFSFNLPDGSVPEHEPAADPQLIAKLREISQTTEETPEVYREALDRLANDPDLDQEDKETIAKLSPSNWETQRRRTKAAELISKFRRDDYPLPEFINHLEKHSKPRSEALRDLYINNAVADQQSLVSFAENNPEAYSRLMVGLATSQPDTIKLLLEKQGYRVEKASESQPFNVDAQLKQLADEDPDNYELIAGTPVEDRIKAILAETAAKDARNRELETQNLNRPQEQVQQSQDDLDFAPEKTGLYQDVINSWESEIDRALRDSGITRPTEEEFRQNFESAMLRDTAYTIAKHGYGDKSPAWLPQLFEWGDKRKGFSEISDNILQAITDMNKDEAKSFGRSASPDVYEFGKLRSQMPAVKAYIAMAKRIMGTVKLADPVTAAVVESGAVPLAPGDPQQNGKRTFLSDKLFLPVAQ